jgi:hypothetical protein
MNQLSDATLSFWYSIFTWVGIVGAIAAVISMVGVYFVGDEIGSRKDTELESLKAAQLPRTLSDSAKLKIKDLLKNCPKEEVIVQAEQADAEGKGFADKIKAVLKKSGFNVLPYPTYELSVPKQGAFIFLKDEFHPPPHAIPLQEAFKAAGFWMPIDEATKPMEILFGPPGSPHALTSEMVIIWVGQKP